MTTIPITVGEGSQLIVVTEALVRRAENHSSDCWDRGGPARKRAAGAKVLDIAIRITFSPFALICGRHARGPSNHLIGYERYRYKLFSTFSSNGAKSKSRLKRSSTLSLLRRLALCSLLLLFMRARPTRFLESKQSKTVSLLHS